MYPRQALQKGAIVYLVAHKTKVSLPIAGNQKRRHKGEDRPRSIAQLAAYRLNQHNYQKNSGGQQQCVRNKVTFGVTGIRVPPAKMERKMQNDFDKRTDEGSGESSGEEQYELQNRKDNLFGHGSFPNQEQLPVYVKSL